MIEHLSELNGFETVVFIGIVAYCTVTVPILTVLFIKSIAEPPSGLRLREIDPNRKAEDE